jgi:hypothetical protein
VITPFSPTDAWEQQGQPVPDQVLTVINELLTQRFERGKRFRIMQDEVVEQLALQFNIPKSEVFTKHMLDFENIYRNQGWTVSYDKPAYNESYRPYWEFLAQ